jgi:hypothetical protein
VSIEEVVDARKLKIDEEVAWELVQNAKSIAVAKGKKVQRFSSVANEKEAVLKNIIGPSGNLRAPTCRVGDDFVVGFNTDLYTESYLKER